MKNIFGNSVVIINVIYDDHINVVYYRGWSNDESKLNISLLTCRWCNQTTPLYLRCNKHNTTSLACKNIKSVTEFIYLAAILHPPKEAFRSRGEMCGLHLKVWTRFGSPHCMLNLSTVPWGKKLTRKHVYGHLPWRERSLCIGGHLWQSKEELVSNILLWHPSHVSTSVGCLLE